METVCMQGVSLTLSFQGKESEQLTAREFQIASVLAASNGPVPREKIVSAVWAEEGVSKKLLDAHLCFLRRKVSKAGIRIRHVPERGFCMEVQADGSMPCPN